MFFNCSKCNKKVSISNLDRPELHNNRCPDCNIVIASGEYEKNIKNGVTLFASIGTNLGHVVMSESLFRFYKDQNPDEEIYFLTMMQTLNCGENFKEHSCFKKLFWADVSNIVDMPQDKRCIHYYFAREVTKIADMFGYYPQWQNKEETNLVNVADPYYILHLRNVHGNTEKNVTEYEAKKIFEKLKDKKVIIVGNDMPFYQFEKEYNFINLRGKLSLNQIAWLCANSEMVIGKDSGPLHLAAASGANVVGYGYYSEYWIPKTKKMTAFIKVNDEFERFLTFL